MDRYSIRIYKNKLEKNKNYNMLFKKFKNKFRKQI